MDKRITDFIANVKDDSGKLLKQEIGAFLGWAIDETNLLAKEQKAELENYMLQLAMGEITPKDLQMYMRSFQRQVKAKLLETEISKDAAGQRLINGIQDLVIGNLLTFL